MVLKKLPPEQDVKFFDPNNGELLCSLNQCYKKFVETSEPKIYTPISKEYYSNIVKFRSYFHKCTECGRKQISRSDETKSKKSFAEMGLPMGPRSNDPELVLTEEEIKYHSEFIKKRTEKYENTVPYEKTIPKPLKRKRNKYGK